MSLRKFSDVFKGKGNNTTNSTNTTNPTTQTQKKDEKMTLTSFQSPDTSFPPIEQETGSFWSRFEN
jgi:hypothetical protein